MLQTSGLPQCHFSWTCGKAPLRMKSVSVAVCVCTYVYVLLVPSYVCWFILLKLCCTREITAFKQVSLGQVKSMTKSETIMASEGAVWIQVGKIIQFWVKNTAFNIWKPSYFTSLPRNKDCEAASCPLTGPVAVKCLMSRHLTVTVMLGSHLLDILPAITVQITLTFAIRPLATVLNCSLH